MGVHRVQGDALLGAVDVVEPSAGSPVDQTVVVHPAVGGEDGGVGQVLAQRGRGLVQVDHELSDVVARGGVDRGELGHVQHVQLGDVNRSLVDGVADGEHEFPPWRVAQAFQTAFLVEDDKVGVLQEVEARCVGHAGVAEIILFFESRDGSVEVVWKDRCLLVMFVRGIL